MSDTVIVRGGGDIATGVIQKLHRSGFNVLVLEVLKPTSIRRNVALSEAVYDNVTKVEDIEAILVQNTSEIYKAWNDGVVPVCIDPKGEMIYEMKPFVVVDAILAKKNLGTTRDMAPITIALGPGFNAGMDVDIVVETMRGHNLGRLVFDGFPEENTGVPGTIAGYSKERVIHSPETGIIQNIKEIGDIIKRNETIAMVGDVEVKTKLSGILRGIIRDGMKVNRGIKIADVDPRLTEINNCHTISDKARNVGGATLEAIMYRKNQLQNRRDSNG